MQTFFKVFVCCLLQVSTLVLPGWIEAAKADTVNTPTSIPTIDFLVVSGEIFPRSNGYGGQFNVTKGTPLYFSGILRVLHSTDEADTTTTRSAKPSTYAMFGVGMGIAISSESPRLAYSIRFGLSWYAWTTNRTKIEYYWTGKTKTIPEVIQGRLTTRTVLEFKEDEVRIWKYQFRPTITFVLGPRKTKMLWVAVEPGNTKIFPGRSVSVGLAVGLE